jgi:phosphoglycolate phosphatase-like HAD superfamily hydrolase
MSIFDSFERKHDYLVCVDSDGCVMDTMNCKHFHCFGPCMVTEWGLEEWKDEILDRWNVINLFSMTRGINRFKGLAMALGEIDQKYKPITGVKALQHWADTAPALSNDGAAKAAAEATDPDAKLVLEKALSWSKAVNRSIVALPEALKVPFAGAKEGLAAAHTFADVAVVSSANRDAVDEEWTQHGLLEHVDIVLAQDVGSKAHCIAKMLEYGYAPEQVLMVGDAPGDYDAAVKNGVRYYPILVNREKESWDRLCSEGLGKLLDGSFAGEYQEALRREFYRNLGADI